MSKAEELNEKLMTRWNTGAYSFNLIDMAIWSGCFMAGFLVGAVIVWIY